MDEMAEEMVMVPEMEMGKHQEGQRAGVRPDSTVVAAFKLQLSISSIHANLDVKKLEQQVLR
jgi:hypothetical protein